MSNAPSQQCLSIGGTAIGFELPTAAIDAVRDHFDYLDRAPADGEPAVWYRAGARTATGRRILRHDPLRRPAVEPIGSDPADLIDDLHLSIALHHRHDVFIHAGAVAWNGVGIVIPGRSRTGKSTLVESLVRLGADYLSDEYARITPAGTIAPYPRPIQLRSPGGRRLVNPSTIGTVAGEPVEPGLVVFTSYDEGTRFDPSPVSPAAAALELFDNTVVAETEPERAMQIVAGLARSTRAVRSPRPDVQATARFVLDLADSVRSSA